MPMGIVARPTRRRAVTRTGRTATTDDRRASKFGALAGLLFGPLGLLIGPVIGAVAGEMIRGGDVERSLRTGVGALIGMVASIAADFVISVAMIGLFLWWVWRV